MGHSDTSATSVPDGTKLYIKLTDDRAMFVIGNKQTIILPRPLPLELIRAMSTSEPISKSTTQWFMADLFLWKVAKQCLS